MRVVSRQVSSGGRQTSGERLPSHPPAHPSALDNLRIGWCFTAEQTPAPHHAHPEGCAALRIMILIAPIPPPPASPNDLCSIPTAPNSRVPPSTATHDHSCLPPC